LGGSVNSGSGRKRLPKVYETVEEVMVAYGMNPKTRHGLKTFALELVSDDVPTPQELRGDDISKNGQCEWDKKKAFINLHKHGVSFEEASLIFEANPPAGCGVLYDDPSDDGTGLESFWGIDIRDKVIGRLPSGACFIVKIDREHTNSSRVRLVSVRRVSEKDVVQAIRNHEANSSVSVVLRVEAADVRKHVVVSSIMLEGVKQRIQEYENLRLLPKEVREKVDDGFVFSGLKRLFRVCGTVNELLSVYRLNPGKQESKEFLANMLERDGVPCPQELRGDGVSSNGRCEWDRKKAFISQYKHGLPFEEVSQVYSSPPIPGYGVLYDDPTDTGTEEGIVWGHYVRNKVVATIGSDRCVLVEVDRTPTVSGRVRIVSVCTVPQKAVSDAINDHKLNSSVSVAARVIFNSFGRASSADPDDEVRARMFRKIQAYENIRYMVSIMGKAF
jgi:uncharacterized DUF497 family protein